MSAKTTRALHEALDILGRGEVQVMTVDKDPSRWASWKRELGKIAKLKPRGQFVHGTSDVLKLSMSDSVVGDPVIFAFIDGCHCFDCVERDIMNIAPHVLPGGEVAFHDAGNQRKLGMQVHERYHDRDGVVRYYGVSEAIIEAERLGPLMGWELTAKVEPSPRPGGPTPIFGGLQVWRKPR